MAGKNVIELTKANFDETINSDQPVLVDFWAAWCGPCRMIAPIVEELADDYEGKAKIGKLNVDNEVEIAQRYRIMSIPTLLIFKNGEIVDKVVGGRPKQAFAQMLDKHV